MGNIQSEIHAHNLNRTNHIYNSFVEAKVNKDFEKAISVDDFNKKFGAGYEIYTPESLEKFEKAITDTCIEKSLTGEEVKTTLAEAKQGLEKVFVNTGSGVKKVFVKKK